MSRGGRAGRLMPCLALGLLLCAACSGGSNAVPEPATPGRPPLRDVVLPDLSKMAASARTQIRERHDTLQHIAARPGVTPVELSNAYGEMGKLLMAAQYGEAAEAAFLNAQTLDTSQFRWPYYLAHLYRTRGESEQARALFSRALQLEPDSVDALVWLGNTELALGQPDRAAPHFSRALALEPGSLSARFGLGRAALAGQDPQRAATLFEDVLKRDPTAAGVHYPLSQAYSALGDTRRAAEHLQQRRERDILPADPLMVELERLVESPQTYETLGIRALEQEDWPAAATAFRKGLDLDPGSASLKFRLATARNAAGDAADAEALFREVVTTAPDYFPAQFSLGVLLQARGDHREAATCFSAALKQRPDYVQARLRLAASQRRLGQLKEAQANYRQVLQTNAQLEEAEFGHAMTLVQLGRFRDARDALVESRKAHPDATAVTHALARLLAAAPDPQVRDGQQAATLVQQLIQKGRTLDLGETLAMSLAELGEFDRAVAVQRDLMTAAKRAALPRVEARLATNLSRYARGIACRTPWTEDELP